MKKYFYIGCFTIFLFNIINQDTCVAGEEEIVAQSEFLISSRTNLEQDHATVAMTQSGEFMVTWHLNTGESSLYNDVIARIFNKDGLAMTDEIIVNINILGHHQNPDVGTDNNKYVVTWSALTGTAGNFDNYARSYSTQGEPLTDEIMVNESSSDIITWPDVAVVENGDFIVVWGEIRGNVYKYYVRHFDPFSVRLTEPILLNKYWLNNPILRDEYQGFNAVPDVAINSFGRGAALWRRFDQKWIALAGRTFNVYTLKAQPEKLIEPPPGDIFQRRPVIDINENGDILIAWTESGITNNNVYVKKYSSTLKQWGEVISLNGNNGFDQHRVTIRLKENGDFIVAWTRNYSDLESDVFMQLFDSSGFPCSEVLLVNETTPGLQRRPAVDIYEDDANTNIIVTWEGKGQLDDNYLIFGRLFKLPKIFSSQTQ